MLFSDLVVEVLECSVFSIASRFFSKHGPLSNNNTILMFQGVLWIKHNFFHATKIKFPFIPVFPQRYKIFWLRNKIPLSLLPLKFCVHFVLPNAAPPTHAQKHSDVCGVGISETWNLKGWKHPDVSQDLFCQQKIWETLRQFSGECQKPGSYQ